MYAPLKPLGCSSFADVAYGIADAIKLYSTLRPAIGDRVGLEPTIKPAWIGVDT